MNKTCSECKYHNNETLECFRLPPQIILNIEPKIPDTTGTNDDRYISRFPRVNHHRQCGEFKIRKVGE